MFTFFSVCVCLITACVGIIIGVSIGQREAIAPILKKNKEIKNDNDTLVDINNSLRSECGDLSVYRANLQDDVDALENDKDRLNEDCDNLYTQSQKQQELLKKQREEVDFQLSEEKKRAANELTDYISTIQEQKDIEEAALESLRQQRAATIEAFKREEQINADKYFYCLQLTDDEVEDIDYLNSIRHRLHYPTAIGKVI